MPRTSASNMLLLKCRTMLPKILVDLARAPEQRWRELAGYIDQARKLTDSYVKDLGGLETFAPMLAAYRAGFVSGEHAAEVDAIAKIIGRSSEEVLLANIYYDAMHAFLGCTAFALDTPSGPIHARNLDWWTENSMLSDHTLIAECSGGSAPGPYSLVGWPGFMGVFSGVAKGRFAITLNAVLSDEAPQPAQSITLLLRKVFDTAADYESALSIVTETPIVADCLLLVSGVKSGQMAVVERTGTKAEVRKPEDGLVVVTNDYRKLNSGVAPAPGNELQETACARFDRATALAHHQQPATAEDCFRILQDSSVKMGITVQHMVMQASTGLLEVRLPEK